MNMSRLALSFATVLIASATQAHTGVGDTNGFTHGFEHPVSGVDHVLVMVAVGLYAAHLGGRALWLVPLSFVSMMVVGGAFGTAGIGFPIVEIGIGLSVVILGVAVASGFHMPTAAAMTMVGIFAIFHGHAHGTGMPESASGFEYGVGFVLATAMLHAFGIGIGLLIGRMSQSYGNRILQLAGSGMALAGIAILTGYMRSIT
jgi:urease accessory protein